MNNKIQELYNESTYIGSGTITEYRNRTENDTVYTDLIVETDTNELEFILEYPSVYNEDNSAIKFINNVGGGSVHGLKSSKVQIKHLKDVSNPPFVTNRMTITEYEENMDDNETDNKMKFTNTQKFIFKLIEYITVFISIILVANNTMELLIYPVSVIFILYLSLLYLHGENS